VLEKEKTEKTQKQDLQIIMTDGVL